MTRRPCPTQAGTPVPLILLHFSEACFPEAHRVLCSLLLPTMAGQPRGAQAPICSAALLSRDEPHLAPVHR